MANQILRAENLLSCDDVVLDALDQSLKPIPKRMFRDHRSKYLTCRMPQNLPIESSTITQRKTPCVSAGAPVDPTPIDSTRSTATVVTEKSGFTIEIMATPMQSVGDGRSRVMTMSVRDLKDSILARGGVVQGCVEREDLETRLLDLMKCDHLPKLPHMPKVPSMPQTDLSTLTKRQSKLRQAFDGIGKGYLTLQEVKSIVSTGGDLGFTDSVVEDLFRRLDDDGDGRISCHDFERILATFDPQSEISDEVEQLSEDVALAQTYMRQEKWLQAKSHFQKALVALTKHFGPDATVTLIETANLGHVLAMLNDLSGSKTLLDRALQELEKTTGPESERTLVCMTHLADVLTKQANPAGARPLFERAWQGFKKTLGAHHPHTLSCEANLAKLLYQQGDLSAARPLLEQALDGLERTNGALDAGTMACMQTLVCVLWQQKELLAAAALLKRFVDRLEKTRGADIAETLSSMKGLGIALVAEGSQDEGASVFKRLMDANYKVVGAEHPETFHCMCLLGGALREQGQGVARDRARGLLGEALEGLRRTAGREDSRTISCSLNLSLLLIDMQDWAAAEALLDRALDDLETTKGHDDPETLKVLIPFSQVLWQQGKMQRAQVIANRAVEGLTKHCGVSHPDTQRAVDLARLISERMS